VVGTTGHSINWTVNEASTTTPTYKIYLNGTENASGTWVAGGIITINVDGLGVGSYEYKAVATDVDGSASDTVIVTVTPASPAIPGYPLFELLGVVVIILPLIAWYVTRTSKSGTRRLVWANKSPEI
jgi:hypothetical protein